MTNGLMLIQAVSDVSQAVTSLATSAMTFGTIRKRDAILLEEKIRLLKHVCRGQGVGILTRQSVEEYDKTLQSILQKDYSGPALDMAMKLLMIQCQALSENIQAYNHSN